MDIFEVIFVWLKSIINTMTSLAFFIIGSFLPDGGDEEKETSPVTTTGKHNKKS